MFGYNNLMNDYQNSIEAGIKEYESLLEAGLYVENQHSLGIFDISKCANVITVKAGEDFDF